MINDKRYSTTKWKKTRMQIKMRDEDSCRVCGCFASEVHHIRKSRLYPELFYNLDNLILLCNRCHKRIETGKYSSVIDNKFLTGVDLLDYIIKNNIRRVF